MHSFGQLYNICPDFKFFCPQKIRPNDNFNDSLNQVHIYTHLFDDFRPVFFSLLNA